MASKSSNRWLRRQRRDRFVNAARREGQVSRAHYKLQQLDERFGLLGRRQWVLELGAAPGGWTAYLAQRLTAGRIVAVDPRPLDRSGGNVEIVQGCLGDAEVESAIGRILARAKGREPRVDLVLSDMAPNISGVRAADQARAMHLAELASVAAAKWLKCGGSLVVKVYQGEGIDAWLSETRRCFARVQTVKPPASRAESRENYVVAREFRGAACG